MVRIMLLLTLGYSALSFGANTYTYCPLSSNGKTVKPPMGFTLVPVTSSKSQDVYHLKPTDENPYGGNAQIWVAYKDSQGRVVKIESGGQKPSQKVVNYELKKREYALKNHFPVKGGEERYTVPGIKEAKMALAQPEDFPIKFGASIEMNFSGNECQVSKLSERYFDSKEKNNVDKVVFNSNKCDSVRNLYSKYEKDITTCTEKLVAHESEIVSLLNAEDRGDIQKAFASGAGGGRGSPIRSVASSEVNSHQSSREDGIVSMASYLRAGASGLGSSLLKEKEFCNILAPSKSSSSDATAIPYPGKASHQ